MDSRETWRLGHRPALDGVRGLAILLVLLEHGGVPGLHTAGAAGVTLFFVLSGFLITTLLLEEHSRTGRISLRRFYVRRARRLAPAFIVSTVVVAAVSLALPSLHLVTVEDVAWAFSYLGNWAQALVHPVPSGLGALSGTWSLAVEEQFYLIWPIVLIAALRSGRRRVWQVVVAGIVLSLAARVVLVAQGAIFWRTYCGTDVNAFALLLGASVALVMTARTLPRSSLPWFVSASCVVAMGALSLTAPNTWAASGVLVTGLSAGLLYALVASSETPALWSNRALRWLGARSYAVYLWNSILSAALYDLDVAWPTRMAATVVPSLLFAEASWWLVERRFQSRSKGGRLVEPQHRQVTVGRVGVDAP